MTELGNKIGTWNESYENHKTTYSEKFDNLENLVNFVMWEFVMEDIINHVERTFDAKILEVGCGGARNSLFLAKKGFNVTCSDYADGALRLAQDNFKCENVKGSFIQDDLLNSKIEPNQFDCVMSFGLLEHFEDLEPLLQSITNTLKPGGIHLHCVITKKFSVGTIRNILFYPLKFIYNLLRGKTKGIFKKSFRDFPHYENSYSSYEYCRVFESVGNKVIKNQAGGIVFDLLSLPFGSGDYIVKLFSKPLYKLIRKLDRSESRFCHFIAPTFYIIAKKK